LTLAPAAHLHAVCSYLFSYWLWLCAFSTCSPSNSLMLICWGGHVFFTLPIHPCDWANLIYYQTCKIGLQSRADELINTIPFLDTVAGEALSMLCTSNRILHEGAIGIRSPLARVSVLLSSSTEFRFSIQIASTGPSKISHTWSPKSQNNVIMSTCITTIKGCVTQKNGWKWKMCLNQTFYT
jgi:hypothetical protein